MSGRTPLPRVRNVLIVEDASSCAEMLEAALCSIPGIRLTSVPTAEDALAALAADSFAAIVTDLNLPCMDGAELITRIRDTLRFRSLPVIVVSGDPDPDASHRALLAGARAFFNKPFSPSAVSKLLEDLLDEP